MGKNSLSTQTKKHRDPMRTYHNKIRKITSWYNHLVKNRQEKNGLGKDKRPLKPLSYFTDKVKQPKTQ